MLCEAFEGGLRRETKSVTSYLFTPRKEFSKLLVEVKRKERELVDKGGTVASVQASEVDALKTLVLELRSEVLTLKNERSQQSSAYSTSVPQQHQTTHSFRDQAPRPQRSRTEAVCWRCCIYGHVRSGCRIPINVCGSRQTTGAVKSCLMGSKTTVDVIVNGRVVRALLDTGATVSVISRATADKLGLPIRPVRDFIHIECANRQARPYLGYLTMSINLPHNSP